MFDAFVSKYTCICFQFLEEFQLLFVTERSVLVLVSNTDCCVWFESLFTNE